MDFVNLFAEASKWGPTAITGITAICIAFIYKKIVKNGEDDALRHQQLTNLVMQEIKKIEEKVEKRFDEHERRILALEMDCLPKDDFYRENSGWRSEINRLSDQLTNQFMKFTENIIAIWKEKTK